MTYGFFLDGVTEGRDIRRRRNREDMEVKAFEEDRGFAQEQREDYRADRSHQLERRPVVEGQQDEAFRLDKIAKENNIKTEDLRREIDNLKLDMTKDQYDIAKAFRQNRIDDMALSTNINLQNKILKQYSNIYNMAALGDGKAAAQFYNNTPGTPRTATDAVIEVDEQGNRYLAMVGPDNDYLKGEDGEPIIYSEEWILKASGARPEKQTNKAFGSSDAGFGVINEQTGQTSPIPGPMGQPELIRDAMAAKEAERIGFQGSLGGTGFNILGKDFGVNPDKLAGEVSTYFPSGGTVDEVSRFMVSGKVDDPELRKSAFERLVVGGVIKSVNPVNNGQYATMTGDHIQGLFNQQISPERFDAVFGNGASNLIFGLYGAQ